MSDTMLYIMLVCIGGYFGFMLGGIYARIEAENESKNVAMISVLQDGDIFRAYDTSGAFLYQSKSEVDLIQQVKLMYPDTPLVIIKQQDPNVVL